MPVVVKRQKKPRKWKGGLAKKIRVQVNRPHGLAVTDADTVAKANAEMNELFERAIEAARIKKLHELMKLWEIEHGDYRSAAIRLAVETGIPGFQVDESRKVGATLYWTLGRLDNLLIAVESTKKKYPDPTTDIDALKQIARRKEWAPPPNHSNEAWIKTLQNKLLEARKIKSVVEGGINYVTEILGEIERKNPEY